MVDCLIARRGVIAGSSAAAILSGCANCAPLKPLARAETRRRIGDAHVHLFNAADLPVAGFLRDVLLPEHAPDLPEVALAFADIGARILKSAALGARAERSRMRAPGNPTMPADLSPERFADALADRIETETRGRGARGLADARPLEDTADSYAVLAALLAEGRARAAGVPGPFSAPAAADGATTQMAAITNIDRGYLARVAEFGGEAAAPPAPTALFTMRGDTAALNVSVVGVWAAIKWCWLMVQSRCYHAHRYLAFAESGDATVTALINLLVDYDAWLADGPASGSAMADQVEFWTDFSARAAARVAIHTFAGYDPLKHAESVKPGGDHPGYFADLKRWFEGAGGDARVAGFKLYPAMGFRVFGNAGQQPGTTRSGARVRARWADKRWPLTTFGRELDDALDLFFDYCGKNDVPLLAHGRNSNAASVDTGRMASPSWWLKRANQMALAGRPLRACIGHFDRTNSDAVAGLRGLLALNRAQKARVYLDISYSEEFIDGRSKVLLDALADLFDRDAATARFLLFGTDWIMLAQEPRADRYVGAARAAFADHPFWRDQLDRVFGENMADFLKHPAR